MFVQLCIPAGAMIVCLALFKLLTWRLPGMLQMQLVELMPVAVNSKCVLLSHIVLCQSSTRHFGRCADSVFAVSSTSDVHACDMHIVCSMVHH